MKKYLIILGLFLLGSVALFAQEENEDDDRGGKLQQRMNEYIQRRLSLSKSEAEKFRPLFFRYLVELRKTHRENRADKPVLQLRIAELRVRFRNEFRQIMDEPRANRVFEHQREFEKIIKDEINQRRIENKPLRRNNSLLQ